MVTVIIFLRLFFIRCKQYWCVTLVKKIVMKIKMDKKNKYTLAFGKRKAVYIWRGTVTLRETGVLWVRTKEGQQLLYTTRQDGKIALDLNGETTGAPIRFWGEDFCESLNEN